MEQEHGKIGSTGFFKNEERKRGITLEIPNGWPLFLFRRFPVENMLTTGDVFHLFFSGAVVSLPLMDTNDLNGRYNEYSELNCEIRNLRRERNALLKDNASAEEVVEIEERLKKLLAVRRRLEREIHGHIRHAAGRDGEDVPEHMRGPFLVAVASTNGKWVNLPIRDARTFYIFEIENGEPRLLEQRAVSAIDAASGEFRKIVGDCDAVMATKIQGRFSKPLLDAGVRSIAVKEDMIEAAIEDHLHEIAGKI